MLFVRTRLQVQCFSLALPSRTFARAPKGFWSDPGNVQQFLESVGKDLDVGCLTDWYTITVRQLQQKGGGGLLYHYGQSMHAVLKAAYPSYPWEPHRFTNVPQGYWKDIGNQRDFLESVSKQLGLREMNDWYSVSAEQVRTQGGTTLLRMYGDSLVALLYAAYPGFDWNSGRVSRVPPGHWNDPNNIRGFFDQVAKDLNVRCLDDWYGIAAEDVRQRGGWTMLVKFQGSLHRALAAAYPEHTWRPWLFVHRPVDAFSDDKVIRDYLSWLASELNIAEHADWGRVPAGAIRRLKGGELLRKFSSLTALVERYLPEHGGSVEDSNARSKIPAGFVQK